MSTSPEHVALLLSQLVALFNRGTIDLPERAVAAACVFRLNGRAYHEHLGRPAADPLVRLIACGPAGYRLLVTRLRYILEDAHVDLRADERREDGPDPDTATVRATLSGRVRGLAGARCTECSIRASADDAGSIREIAVTIGDADLEMLMAARHG
jgi:hypothetical protein